MSNEQEKPVEAIIHETAQELNWFVGTYLQLMGPSSELVAIRVHDRRLALMLEGLAYLAQAMREYVAEKYPRAAEVSSKFYEKRLENFKT